MTMRDFIRRFCVAGIAIAVITLLLWFSDVGPMPYLVSAVVAALAGIALWEYAQFAKAKGVDVAVPLFVGFGVVGVVMAPFVVFFLGGLVLFARHFRRISGAIVDLAASLFGWVYIAIPMGLILHILYTSGALWVAYLLLVTKITDVGAYFGGGLFGKRPLSPTVSPKKTVEGAVSGLVCALAMSLWFGLSWLGLSAVTAIVLGAVLSIIGQFSDLAESLLKRDANKKDSNKLPGLGGVLDFIDSLLFTAPVLFIYLEYTVL